MMANNSDHFLPYEQLQTLIQVLIDAGFHCIGPQVRDATIVYDTITEAHQLPWGMRDHQQPGEYRLETLPERKAFAFANGPQAIKPILFKPRETVWRVIRDTTGKLTFKPHAAAEKPYAIIGARACDIAAMRIQDQVFLAKAHPDTHYQNRRETLLIIAVQCTYASNNCFCVSAGTGPQVSHPFDILMTEIIDGFVINSGSPRGAEILSALTIQVASTGQSQAAIHAVKQAADMQTKRIPLNNQPALQQILFDQLEHERWQAVATRCLSCGNCTSVCPTCFCHSESDKPTLQGDCSEHVREWDSCFTAGHSELGGKPIRADTQSRYKQWLTHKVGSWFEQFGTSGCVGCGRCVTWCPVGIDITEELAAITGESNMKEIPLK